LSAKNPNIYVTLYGKPRFPSR